jgi:hypothetical protein
MTRRLSKRRYPCAMQPGKWQRNAIFDAIGAGGLEAAECSFVYDDVAWRITHLASGSSLAIEGAPGPYNVTAVVGEDPSLPSKYYTWPNVEERVQRWAREVKRDVDTPDLWAELRGRQGILSGPGYEDIQNTPFAPDEQAEILERIRQIKEFVHKAYSLSAVQLSSIDAKLDDIASAARRVGRKDWLLMFSGVILSVILTDLLAREVVWDIFTMALNGLGHLFVDLGGPPQLPPAV